MTFCWKDIPPLMVDGLPGARQPSTKVQLRRWFGLCWRRASKFCPTSYFYMYALFFAGGIWYQAGDCAVELMLWPRFSAAEGENLFRHKLTL